MIQIREIKQVLKAMKDVKDFDDNAYFAMAHDPRYLESHGSSIRVEFIENDIHVTLEAPIGGERG